MRTRPPRLRPAASGPPHSPLPSQRASWAREARWANGRLVLVNPAGIAVGSGAVVDTAGFTASTLKMSDADALAGRLRFASDGVAGNLSVNGNIVSRGGDVVLIAPNVQVGAPAVIQA